MQLIVISGTEDIADEAAIINDLFQAGLLRLHLRKPGSTLQQVRVLLDGIDAAFYNRIALHQHHGLASEYGITRQHYPEHMRVQTMSDELIGQRAKGYTLSTSVHDLQAIASLAGFDYAFLGPVFNSLSKPGYNSTLQFGFSLNKQDVKPEIIAIGGIEPQKISTIKAMGFDGIAVLGTIWGQPEKAVRTFESLQDTINRI